MNKTIATILGTAAIIGGATFVATTSDAEVIRVTRQGEDEKLYPIEVVNQVEVTNTYTIGEIEQKIQILDSRISVLQARKAELVILRDKLQSEVTRTR